MNHYTIEKEETQTHFMNMANENHRNNKSLTAPSNENLYFVLLSPSGWIAGFSPDLNIAQIDLTLNFFDEQSIGTPFFF